MSSSLFSSKDYGRYYYFTQHIELDNDILNLEKNDVLEVINSECHSKFNENQLDFYKTYVHECIHFLDSTATLWGIEYSTRLYNCFNSGNDVEFVKTFSISNSEIGQHALLGKSESFGFIRHEKMRSILSYDSQHGVYINFIYYGYVNSFLKEVYSTPLSMLALLEGHAYAQETLTAINIFHEKKDIVSITLIERSYKDKINEKKYTEYTCVLAFIEQLFPNAEFRVKLTIACKVILFSLNIPSFFQIPHYILDGLFRDSDKKLISALKMEFSRSMNRSSLLCILLIILKHIFDEKPLGKDENVEDYIFDNLLSIFNYQQVDLDEFKSSFYFLWQIEYNAGCNIMKEKGIDLAYISASKNVNYSWSSFQAQNNFLPQIMLSDLGFVNQKKHLKFDFEKHCNMFNTKANILQKAIDELKKKKQHLSLVNIHDWYCKIIRGEFGINFYPD